MVNNYNTSISKRAADMLNVRDGQFFDNNLSNTITPVIDINNPICDIVRNVSTGTDSSVIYTTPTDKDFYLTGVVLSYVKDASSDSTRGTVNVVINGLTVAVAGIGGITLTALNQTVSISYPFPIKLDRGTTISISHAGSVGVTRMTVSIIGYISDTLRY